MKYRSRKMRIGATEAERRSIVAAERQVNIEMWQRQGDEAIFAAAWRIVELHHLADGGRLEDLEMRRDIARLRRISWAKRKSGHRD